MTDLLACRMLANVLFPNWLITLLLLGLLIFLTYKTARKAWSLHRSEVRYLAQRAEQRPRPAVTQKKVSAAERPVTNMEMAERKAFSEGHIMDKGSSASASSVAGQTGAHVEKRDLESGGDMHSMNVELDQPGTSRQCASLEVEGLPQEGPSGEQSEAADSIRSLQGINSQVTSPGMLMHVSVVVSV